MFFILSFYTVYLQSILNSKFYLPCHRLVLRNDRMSSNRLVLATILIITFLFLAPPVLACNYPGPEGSSITVNVYAADGKTPLPGASVTLKVFNGSKPLTSVGPEGADDNGQFTFPGASEIVAGLTYQIHATFYGEEVSIDCTGPEHSADSCTFTLGNGQHKTISISIPGVSVTHGGEGPTATACPSNKPQPPVKPITPPGNHSSYPAMQPGEKPGIVTGVILAADGETPVSGAYVAIVSAGNVPKVNCVDGPVEYSCMYTDCNGFYQFCGVNCTAEAVYKLYVTDGLGNTAYSEPFKVPSGETVKLNLAFSPKDDGKATPTPTIEPTVTPVPDTDVNATALTSEPALKELSVSRPRGESGIIEQITGFIGSILASVLPK
jgi:hypothetical protein